MRRFFRFLSNSVVIICGIVGLIMGLRLIADMWGTFWTTVCFFLFPIPLYVSPWIAIFRDGNWTLFLVSYGGTAAAWILNLISDVFTSRKHEL